MILLCHDELWCNASKVQNKIILPWHVQKQQLYFMVNNKKVMFNQIYLDFISDSQQNIMQFSLLQRLNLMILNLKMSESNVAVLY
jgi:hypothetical protein